MATPAQRTNTWILDEWYDQAVAGTTGGYTAERKLWTWGLTEAGSLGLNAGGDPGNQKRSSPTQIPGTTWSQISSTSYKSGGAIKTDGTLWVWGQNYNGALGQNDTVQYSSPIQVGTNTDWARVMCGNEITLACKTDGTLWAWGKNEQGKLGLNQTFPSGRRSSPCQVGTDTTWSSAEFQSTVCDFENATYWIKTDGTMYAWGYNPEGQLGQNDKTSRSSPTQIPGTTWSKLGGLSQGCSAIKTDGTLWTWGGNDSGRLGHNNTTKYSSPKQVPGTWTICNGGQKGSFGIKTNGTLWSWGGDNSGANGVLGLNQYGPGTQYSSPKQVGTQTTWAHVQAGTNQAFAKKTDNTLWVWGSNEHGALGINIGPSNNPDPGNANRSSPTQLPGTWGDFDISGGAYKAAILTKL